MYSPVSCSKASPVSWSICADAGGLGDGDLLTLEEGLWEAEGEILGLKEGLRDGLKEGDRLAETSSL